MILHEFLLLFEIKITLKSEPQKINENVDANGEHQITHKEPKIVRSLSTRGIYAYIHR